MLTQATVFIHSIVNDIYLNSFVRDIEIYTIYLSFPSLNVIDLSFIMVRDLD